MFSHRVEALLRVAARETLDRIRADRQAGPWKLAPLLAYIEEHLFEPELTICGMTRACGVSDHSIASFFKSQLGETPREYVEDCRLIVAWRLLRDSDLAVAHIAELVGYSDLKIFSHAFRRWCEMPPSALRKSLRRVREATQADEDWNAARFLRRAVNGELEPKEQTRLQALLDELYPARGAPRAPAALRVGPAPDEAVVERALAEDLWRRIAEEPLLVQRAAVRGRRSPALFALLREKSLAEHRDRRRKTELAELALAVLTGDAGPPDDDLAELEALAWATVGGARSLVEDFMEAERAFAQAAIAWSRVAKAPDPLIDAEIRFLKAAFVHERHRLGEALGLVCGAITILRPRERPVPLAGALVELANIYCRQGRPGAAIPVYREAIQLLEGRDEPYLITVAHGGLATAHAVSGAWGAAAEELATARILADTFGFPILQQQVSWNQAYVCQGRRRLDTAEQLFAQAERGLRDLGAMGHAALASMDLALLVAVQGRGRQAATLASRALPTLEVLDDRAAAAAYHLFCGDVEQAKEIRRTTWFAGELDE